MADAARLSRRGPRRWLLLLLLVLAAHLLAIDWVDRHLQPIGLLPKMAQPLFTRLLQQQAPPAQLAAATAPPAPPELVRPQVRAIAPAAKRPARAASEPTPPKVAPAPARAASSPDDLVAPEPAASAPRAVASARTPEPAASAPRAVASAAVPKASAPATPAIAAASAASAPGAAASAPVIGLAADGWPVDTRVNYRLGGYFRGPLHGSARVQWLRDGPRYETRIDIDITLLTSLTLTSQGVVTPQGLKPDAYEELRRNDVRRDTLGDDLILLGNGKLVPRPPGVQDTASQFVELSHRFASGQEALQVGRSVKLWLARPGGVDLWTYDIVGRDLLATPELGTVEAYHLRPHMIDKPRGNITAEIWFAPTLQYLPVQIRIDMGKDTYVDLVVLNIQQR